MDIQTHTLAEALALERSGHSFEGTRRIRVRHGVYVMRDRPGRYLLRIRLPAGMIDPARLEALAHLAEAFCPAPRVHITTRQSLELYDLDGETLPTLVGELERIGLTTRNSGGNTVRGVVCCARAGLSGDQPFDVTPYALAIDRFLVDHPEFQNLPRKVKISLEGCASDHVHTAVADIGIRAVGSHKAPGFRITVGGGLGAVPMMGVALESFTPADKLVTTVTAILRVFNEHGNRDVRARARLKWLVKEWGEDRLRETILRRREEGQDGPAPEIPVSAIDPAGTAIAVGVRIPFGDLSTASLRVLADIARRFCTEIRLTVDQNVLLRGVPDNLLPAVRERLGEAGLSDGDDESVIDITRCAGRTSCTLAITDSCAAAAVIADALEPDLAHHPAVQGLRIRVSGCPNSCSHHHLADIGLFGMSRSISGQPAPFYAVLLGGGAQQTSFAAKAIHVPARRVGLAVRRILIAWIDGRREGEPFHQFAGRIGAEGWTTLLHDLVAVDQEPAPSWLHLDNGRDELFTLRSK